MKNWAATFELWLKTVFLTGLGWPLSAVVVSNLLTAAGLAEESLLRFALQGLIGGAAVGIFLTAVFGSQVRREPNWMLATTAGWLAGLIATALVGGLIPSGAGWLFGAGLGGLIFGFALRRALAGELATNDFLVFLQGLGWLLVAAFSAAVSESGSLIAFGAGSSARLAAGMVGWVIAGLVAGVLLVTLFPNRAGGILKPEEGWWY